MIECQKHLFRLPDDVSYLNCAYMSPLLRSVEAAARRGLERQRRPWQIVSEDFFTDTERARELFAGLIGACADDIALTPSASFGIGVAAANLPFKRGQRVLVLDEQYPSNVYAWRELVSTNGGEILTIGRPDDDDWASAVLKQLDERVGICALPQVHWTDGSVVDLKPIATRCRELSISLVLDLSQSLGAMPFSVSEIDADYGIGAAYKWLFGPYGLSFLYARTDRQDGRPLDYNWISRANSEDFAGLVLYRDEYRPGARRYDAGERASQVMMPMAVAALEQVHAWGVAEIATTLAAFNTEIVDRAEQLGLSVPASAARAPHMLGVRFPKQVPDELFNALRAGGVHVGVRGSSIRIAPHLYNESRDIDRLFDVLAKAI